MQHKSVPVTEGNICVFAPHSFDGGVHALSYQVIIIAMPQAVTLLVMPVLGLESSNW